MGLHFKLFINKIKRLTNTIFSLDHIKKINVPKSRNVKYSLWSQSRRIEFNCIRNKDKPCIRMHWYTFVNCLLHNSIFEKITFPMVLLSSQKMLTGERDWTAGGKWWRFIWDIGPLRRCLWWNLRNHTIMKSLLIVNEIQMEINIKHC